MYTCTCTVNATTVLLQDVEESASVAMQLTRRGRGEVGGGEKEGGGGMDIESLREFLRQVETLPCKVPEAKLLEVCALYTCSMYIHHVYLHVHGVHGIVYNHVCIYMNIIHIM